MPGTPNGVTVRGLRVLVVPDFQDRMERSSALAVRVLVSELCVGSGGIRVGSR